MDRHHKVQDAEQMRACSAELEHSSRVRHNLLRYRPKRDQQESVFTIDFGTRLQMVIDIYVQPAICWHCSSQDVEIAIQIVFYSWTCC